MKIKRTIDLNEEVPKSTRERINNQLTKLELFPGLKYSLTGSSKDHLRCKKQFEATVNENCLSVRRFRTLFETLESKGCLKGREDFSLYLFSTNHR